MREANWNARRAPDESFESYRLRRQEMNEAIRKWLKGRLIWNSKAKGTKVGKFYREAT